MYLSVCIIIDNLCWLSISFVMDDHTLSTENVDVQPDNFVNFISAQQEVNKVTRAFMESQAKKQDEISSTMALIQKLLEKREDPPSNKRRKVDSEATMGSSSTSTENEAILGSNSEVPLGNEDILTSNVSSGLDNVVTIHADDNSLLEDEEAALLKQLESKASTDGFQDSAEGTVMSKEELEEFLTKEYKEMLAQTEEKLGPAVTQAIGVLCERLWAKVLLDKDRKTELWDSIDIPSNCTGLKASRLNSAIYIRVPENVHTKDYAAQLKQRGLSRAAIPILYAMGEMDNQKIALDSQAKFLSHEPTSLEEAKKMLKVIKNKNEASTKALASAKKQVNKSYQVLNYMFTETNRKRRQDVCTSLGANFKPYGSEIMVHGEDLFDKDVMAKMSKELSKVTPKQNVSKNSSTPSKARRGGHHQGNRKNNQNGGGNWNASNNYSPSASGAPRRGNTSGFRGHQRGQKKR